MVLITYEILLITHLIFSLIILVVTPNAFDNVTYKMRLGYEQINRGIFLLLFMYYLFMIKRVEIQLNSVKYDGEIRKALTALRKQFVLEKALIFLCFVIIGTVIYFSTTSNFRNEGKYGFLITMVYITSCLAIVLLLTYLLFYFIRMNQYFVK